MPRPWERAWLRSAIALATLTAAPSSGALTAGDTRTAETWTVDPARSELVIHVHRKGLLSPFLHDHHFVPTAWTANARFDPARPEAAHVRVVVDASSLRDRQPKLSAQDRLEVEGQGRGPDVLDAESYPEVEFTADRLEITPEPSQDPNVVRGQLVGSLRLHGRARPLRVPVVARWSSGWLRVNGNASLAQSAFGIEPYKTALGAIAVHDRVDVEFSLHAVR